jgi:hypothetical protein
VVMPGETVAGPKSYRKFLHVHLRGFVVKGCA